MMARDRDGLLNYVIFSNVLFLCYILQVCFKQAIFALLPRMVFGLFYNTPLVGTCS